MKEISPSKFSLLRISTLRRNSFPNPNLSSNICISLLLLLKVRFRLPGQCHFRPLLYILAYPASPIYPPPHPPSSSLRATGPLDDRPVHFFSFRWKCPVSHLQPNTTIPRSFPFFFSNFDCTPQEKNTLGEDQLFSQLCKKTNFFSCSLEFFLPYMEKFWWFVFSGIGLPQEYRLFSYFQKHEICSQDQVFLLQPFLSAWTFFHSVRPACWLNSSLHLWSRALQQIALSNPSILQNCTTACACAYESYIQFQFQFFCIPIAFPSFSPSIHSNSSPSPPLPFIASPIGMEWKGWDLTCSVFQSSIRQ